MYEELEKWIDPNRTISQVDENENPMLNLGNVLLKLRKKSDIVSA
jgi:hypothetical protein